MMMYVATERHYFSLSLQWEQSEAENLTLNFSATINDIKDLLSFNQLYIAIFKHLRAILQCICEHMSHMF